MKKYALINGLFAILALTGAAHAASVPGFSVTPTSSGTLANPPFTLGYEFSANSAVEVTELGIFDSDQDGLTDSYQIGLFNASGTLLTSTTVPSGTGSTLIDQFRYVATSPVTLSVGANYFIGALFTTSDDGVLFPGSTTVGSTAALNYIGATFAFGGTLAAPTIDAGPGGYFGPNLIVSSVSTVPLPASLPMFGMALLGLGAIAYSLKERAGA